MECYSTAVASTGDSTTIVGILTYDRLDDSVDIYLLNDVVVEDTEVEANADQRRGIFLGIAEHLGVIAVDRSHNVWLNLCIDVEDASLSAHNVDGCAVMISHGKRVVGSYLRPGLTVSGLLPIHIHIVPHIVVADCLLVGVIAAGNRLIGRTVLLRWVDGQFNIAHDVVHLHL